MEPVPEGTQLSFGSFAQLGHESFYWQLPGETYQETRWDTAGAWQTTLPDRQL